MKYKELKKKILEIYDTIPKTEMAKKCHKKCLSGECRAECCTVTGCAEAEKELINKYIKRNNLDLPLIEKKYAWGYVLPNSHGINEIYDVSPKEAFNVKCKYLKDNKCSIYEVRPLICRLFGLTDIMPCTYFREEVRMTAEETFQKYLKKLVKIMD